MPKITITIPDVVYNRVKDAFDSTGGATSTQKEQMILDAVISLILDRVSNFESQKAAVTATQNAISNVKKDIQLQTDVTPI